MNPSRREKVKHPTRSVSGSPVFVVTGALLLGEPVTLRMVTAMVIILAGVALIQIDRQRAAG